MLIVVVLLAVLLVPARLRRKTSHHVPAPPADHHHESTTSDGGTSASSSQADSHQPRPPPLRRRTSHPPATLKSVAPVPVPFLNLPPGQRSSQFDDLFHRGGGGGGSSRPSIDPTTSNAHLSADSASSGMSRNGAVTHPGTPARSRQASFGSGAGPGRPSSRGSERRSSKDELAGFLTAGPRVLPRSFFGGEDIEPLSAAPSDRSGRPPSKGGVEQNGNVSSSAGSAGESSGGSSQPGGGRHHHHHHHPERKKHINLDHDTTPIDNLPDLSVDEDDVATPKGDLNQTRRTSCESPPTFVDGIVFSG